MLDPLDGQNLVDTLRAFNVTYPLDALEPLDPLVGSIVGSLVESLVGSLI